MVEVRFGLRALSIGHHDRVLGNVCLKCVVKFVLTGEPGRARAGGLPGAQRQGVDEAHGRLVRRQQAPGPESEAVSVVLVSPGSAVSISGDCTAVRYTSAVTGE